MSEKIQEIVDAIKEGRCVLVLGPEICQIDYKRYLSDTALDFNPRDFDESLRIAYQYYLNNHISATDKEYFKSRVKFDDYPFIKEHLLTVDSPATLTHIYKFAEWYFKETNDWNEHFTKIANIRFPLVLSMLPDDNLEKAYEETFQDKTLFQVSRFSRTNQDVPDIKEQTKNKPLIYKLLGGLRTKDATFTFDDWFEYFGNIFGGKSIPNEIANVLNENPLILFLGVRIEKWYIQLLIRLLINLPASKLVGSEKIASVNVNEEGVHQLGRDRFNLVFDDTKPVELLNQLYKACAENGLLRKVKPNIPQMQGTIFISYNHADTKIAHRLKDDLEATGLTVLIDSDNPIGFEIPKFINNSLKEADFILQLISKNFLTSAWVAQESVRAFLLAEVGGKVVLPCQLDNALSDIDFRNKAMESFEEKRKVLATQIAERVLKGEGVPDLHAQHQRILDLKNSYDNTIAEFRNKNRGDLRGDNYEQGFEQIIKAIQNYQSKN